MFMEKEMRELVGILKQNDMYYTLHNEKIQLYHKDKCCSFNADGSPAEFESMEAEFDSIEAAQEFVLEFVQHNLER